MSNAKNIYTFPIFYHRNIKNKNKNYTIQNILTITPMTPNTITWPKFKITTFVGSVGMPVTS